MYQVSGWCVNKTMHAPIHGLQSSKEGTKQWCHSPTSLEGRQRTRLNGEAGLGSSHLLLVLHLIFNSGETGMLGGKNKNKVMSFVGNQCYWRQPYKWLKLLTEKETCFPLPVVSVCSHKVILKWQWKEPVGNSPLLTVLSGCPLVSVPAHCS